MGNHCNRLVYRVNCLNTNTGKFETGYCNYLGLKEIERNQFLHLVRLEVLNGYDLLELSNELVEEIDDNVYNQWYKVIYER